MAEAQLPAPYPLAWPPGRERTPARSRQVTRYQVRSVQHAIETIEAEIKRWRAPERTARITGWELTSNYLGRAMPDDPGAALWFNMAGKDITTGQSMMVLSCDRFDALPQNIRALSLNDGAAAPGRRDRCLLAGGRGRGREGAAAAIGSQPVSRWSRGAGSPLVHDPRGAARRAAARRRSRLSHAGEGRRRRQLGAC